MSKGRPAGKPDAWAKNYTAFIARLVKLGCTFCKPCHAYLGATHECRSYRPPSPALELEAATFAAGVREN